jgi:hypothetical protein
MKLRNKKTGAIIQVSVKCENGGELRTFDLNTNIDKPITLAELNEEWEDYEEPKEYWYITEQAAVIKMVNNPEDIPNFVERCLSIGNLFETKEEAEKAVEKLKAWKRLKDKGFINEQVLSMNLNWCNTDDDDWKALKLLFGGE